MTTGAARASRWHALLACAALLGGGLRQHCQAAGSAEVTLRDAAGTATLRLAWQDGALVATDQGGTERWREQLVEPPVPGASCPPLRGAVGLLAQDTDRDGLVDAARGERARAIVVVESPAQRRVIAFELTGALAHRRLWERELPVALGPAAAGSVPYPALPGDAPAFAQLRIAGQDDPGGHVVALGRAGGGLLLLDALSGRTLWSAADAATTAQQVAGFAAGFRGSVTAVDLDGDGWSDRLYAGDLTGTLWRLDATGSTLPSSLLAINALARFPAADGTRGFVAPPDVARAVVPGLAPLISIAIGTATLQAGTAAVANRLYLLRDSADPRSPPPDAPLTEADLAAGGDAAQPAYGSLAPRGFWVALGGAGSLARATTAGSVVFYTEAATSTAGNCEADVLVRRDVTVGALALATASAALDLDGDGVTGTGDLRRRLASGTRADAAVEVRLAAAAARPGEATCSVDGALLPACVRLRRVLRAGWRREDAD